MAPSSCCTSREPGTYREDQGSKSEIWERDCMYKKSYISVANKNWHWRAPETELELENFILQGL